MKDPLLSFIERIEVDPRTGCWLWRGHRDPRGYGRFSPPGRRTSAKVSSLAHRWAFERFIGPVPAGLVLDHFYCDTTSCANPCHVRPATQRENVLRSDSPVAWRLAQTHCKRGHEFTPQNTCVRPDGRRKCKRCNADAEALRRAA